MGIRLLAVCGLPSCGKTTVGLRLATDLGVGFLRESAERLIDEGYSPGAGASEDFDQKIMQFETRRDLELLESKNKSCIVESWHIGNYSYCLARNSLISAKYKEILNSSGRVFNIGCLFLKISPELSIYRCQELKWPGRDGIKKAEFHTIEFLQRLDSCFRYVLKEFPIRTFEIDSSRSITQVVMVARKCAAKFFALSNLDALQEEM